MNKTITHWSIEAQIDLVKARIEYYEKEPIASSEVGRHNRAIWQDCLATLERVKASPMEWMSVKERLPFETLGKWGKEVLVYTNTGEIGRSQFHRPIDEGFMDSWMGYGTDEITHWMPLPAPPKEVKG